MRKAAQTQLLDYQSEIARDRMARAGQPLDIERLQQLLIAVKSATAGA